MEKNAAPRTRLEPGETSIDQTPNQREDGTVVLGWSVRLRNGQLVRKRTQGTGFAQAYSTYLRVVARDLKGLNVADAMRPDNLERLLRMVRDTRGAGSMASVNAVLRHVMVKQLFRDGLLPANYSTAYLHKPRTEPRPSGRGGVALSERDWGRTIDHLLALCGDPEATPRTNRAAEVALVQAATGMRMGEVRAARGADVQTDGAAVWIELDPHKTKTRKGRRAYVCWHPGWRRGCSRCLTRRAMGI